MVAHAGFDEGSGDTIFVKTAQSGCVEMQLMVQEDALLAQP